jgi:hypothetical protein
MTRNGEARSPDVLVPQLAQPRYAYTEVRVQGEASSRLKQSVRQIVAHPVRQLASMLQSAEQTFVRGIQMLFEGR